MIKRDGYGLFQTLPTSQAIHGGYHFQQSGGSDVQLWGSSTTLYGIVSDGSPVALATGTLNATWQCTDSQGNAYCFTSSNDTPIKTDGTKTNTSYLTANGFPAGTMGAFTPLQLAVAGVTGNANTIYISGSLAFTNFTVGILPTSPFQEPIASPGSRITHLAYYFGRLFWWKDQSFGFATFTNQNDWQLTIVSNQVGTLDNSDAFWNSSGFDAGTMFSGTQEANAYQTPGGIYFRGQDNHIYVYDGYYLTRLSRIITPTVTASSRQKASAWTQNTQANFQSGSILPSNSLSTTISPNSVITASFTATENTVSQWAKGTLSNLMFNGASIVLSTNAVQITNNSFESTTSCSGGTCASSWTYNNANAFTAVTSNTGPCGTLSPQDGTEMIFSGLMDPVALINTQTGATIASQTVSYPAVSCTWLINTMAIPASAVGLSVKLVFTSGGDTFTSSPFIANGNSIQFYMGLLQKGSPTFASFFYLDNVTNNPASNITSGNFTSQVYDTNLSSSVAQFSAFNYIANTSTPTFSLFTSSTSAGPWTNLTSSTGTNKWGQRFYMYSSTISVIGSSNALTAITGVTTVAQSTGSFYSAVNNAPNINTWGTLNVTDSLPGNSSIAYFTRAATNTFTVQSATPTWVSQGKNSTVAASTGTFFQLRADYSVTAATETPSLSNFTFNWFEGTAADKSYMSYFNDAIWFSVSSSSSASTNNEILYWDLLNGAWSIFNIPANGFLVENNALYFGDPTATGKLYKFGGVTTDNGAAINSYWRSKSFLFTERENSGNGQTLSFPATDDLFVQKEFTQADFILGESSTTMNYTYTLDSKTSTLFQFTAFDSSASLIQRNFLLPVGKIGKYYDFKIGDNSSSPAWKLFAHRARYNTLNWKPVLN